jgi:hypothetical protein
VPCSVVILADGLFGLDVHPRRWSWKSLVVSSPRFQVREVTLGFHRVVAAGCAIGWKGRLYLLRGVPVTVGHYAALVPMVA